MNQTATGRIPSFRTSTILLVLLSLSIGWGIRGNYGHEAGAMIPGALAAIAAALLSGREDWRRRVPFFAFFGALGWAFGGSIAYMVPTSYTASGHLPTQVYGFFATFFQAFLWAGLGGAATAYAAVEDREKLTAIFRPLLWVFGFWALQYVIQDTPFDFQNKIFAAFGADRTDFRQRDPLYWLDSEWVEAVLALVALCAFDLWDRRFSKLGQLVLFTLVGAAVGWGVQYFLAATGWQSPLVHALVQPQGDLTLLDPATHEPKFAAENLITNWPVLFTKLGSHLGCVLGAAAGIAIYFKRYGAWRSGSDLLARMASWSLIVFIVGPVLLSNLPIFESVGGFRLAPPRGDSWANILGCYIGFVLHFRKVGNKPLVFAALLAGALGGFALTTAQFIKLLLVAPGNPVLTDSAAVIEFWKHWRSANWHSIALEQFAGFLYGLAVLVPLGILATRLPLRRNEPRSRPWTEIFAVVFVLNIVGYINVVKNVDDWTGAHPVGERFYRSVEEFLRAPLIGNLNLSAWSWFTLMWLAFTAVTVWVLARHRKQPIALFPITWLGRGQLFYLTFLWLIVIANFAKALVAFHHSRIATEGAVMVNALICTVLLLVCARPQDELPPVQTANYATLIRQAVLWNCVFLVGAMTFYTAGVRAVYGDKFAGWGGNNQRFGENADWRVRPILKSGRHR